MQNNKLYSLLESFSKNDLQRFAKYVNSPFFNENKELVQLFHAIKKGMVSNNKTEKEVSKLGLWLEIFPDKPYDDTRFRRLCSDLLKLAMEYLAYQQFKKAPLVSSLFLLPQLSVPQLDKHFTGVVRQMDKNLSQSDFKDSDYHYLNYMMLQRRYEHLEHSAKKAVAFDFIEKSDYHLDCYYFSKKLQHYSDSLSYQSMISGAAALHHFPHFLEYIQQTPYLNEPAVKAWHLVVLMIKNPEEEGFFMQLKKLLEEEGNCFQKKELQTLFIHLMNYCISIKIHKGNESYYHELLSLYKTGLAQNILFENGELNPHHYKNIITNALRVKAFNWVENFIQKYTPMLPPADRSNALTYNLANVYFHKSEYEKVIGQLREVEYQDITYALGSKLMLLRTYYELEEVNPLDSLIDSFRIYLRRNRHISKEVKQQYMNTLRFTRKLLGIARYDQKAKEKIIGQIESCKTLVLKQWLLDKVGDL